MLRPSSLHIVWVMLGMLAIMLGTLILITYHLLSEPIPATGLGQYTLTWDVLSNVPGIDGPAVEAGGIVVVRGERCVRDGEPVQVIANRIFYNTDDQSVVKELIDVGQTRAAPCTLSDLMIQLPAQVTPGHWRVIGRDQEVGQRGESRTWYSQIFTVVPKR